MRTQAFKFHFKHAKKKQFTELNTCHMHHVNQITMQNPRRHLDNQDSFFHGSGNGYFYQSFDEDSWGSESGSRVENVEPYCGRKALYDPDKLYKADETYIRDRVKGTQFDVQTFPQVTTDLYNIYS